MTTQHLQLLEKMVQIYSWHRECCNSIGSIALETPESFHEKLTHVEDLLSKAEPDHPLTEVECSLDQKCYSVYEIATYSDPLRKLMLEKPLLSRADVDEVADYASIADIAPDANPAIMLNSKDALFMKLLGRILKQFPSTPNDIFRENLSSLMAIRMEYPEIMAELLSLSVYFNWTEILKRIYTCLNNKDEEEIKRLPVAAQNIFRIIADIENKEADAKSIELAQNAEQNIPQFNQQFKPSVRDFLFGVSEITTIQRDEIILFQQIDANLAEIETGLIQESWKDFSAKQKGESIARELLKRNIIRQDKLQLIENRISRRMDAAKYYVGLREYVKFNALNHAWPELSSELINNRARFLAFESRMLDIETLADEAKGESDLARLLQRYKDNDQLLHFLQLRPYFSGLSIEKAKEIYNLAASLPQSELGKVKPQKDSLQAANLQTEKVEIPSGVIDTTVYHNLHITISREDSNDVSEDEKRYLIKVQMTDTPTEEVRSSVIIQNQKISYFVESIKNILRFQESNELVRSPEIIDPGYRLPSQSMQKILLSDYLKEIGSKLSQTFFVKEVAQFIRDALNKYSRIRFSLQLENPELKILPWECLYLPEFRLPVALVSKYSLVRYLPSNNIMMPSSWRTKIRILVLFSSPARLAPLMLAEEEKVLREIFSNTDSIQAHFIEHATIGDLQGEIRRFDPHIIQFSGHGGIFDEGSEGGLIFEFEPGLIDQEGRGHVILASKFSTACRDSNVSLVVLNACDTGKSDINNVVTSVAGALVADGIPSAIATTRVVNDMQSIIFMREFYRAVIDGYSVEAALAEARKRIYNNEGDWSVFALFSNTIDLDKYKLITEQKS